MTGYVTLALIAVTVIGSWQAWQQPLLRERLRLGPPAIERQHQYDRLLTHGFIHADWGHLLFNMITLYSFGSTMERYLADRTTSVGYMLFYLSAVVVAILTTYIRHKHDAHYRSLGASGAVSAGLFAFILLSPWSSIYVFLVPVGIPAIVYAVLYVAYSIWMDKRGGDNINHSAHLWGGLYGVMFTLLQDPGQAGRFLQRLAGPGFS